MILLEQLEAQLDALNANSLRRRRRTAETACEPRVTVDGHAMLAFCSNDYLGLAAHPKIVAALQQGAQLYGVGSGASHLISGHSRAHAVLEEQLAEFLSPHLESARALYFCTGYMANLAVLSGPGRSIRARHRDLFRKPEPCISDRRCQALARQGASVSAW